MRPSKMIAASAALIVLSGCTGGGTKPSPSRPPNLAFKRGGTLRVSLFGWVDHEHDSTTDDGKGHYALDPQSEPDSRAWELSRCCLLRTLLSYNGRPTGEGGADPKPDLAAGMPTVSSDGLTWTFHLKH